MNIIYSSEETHRAQGSIDFLLEASRAWSARTAFRDVFGTSDPASVPQFRPPFTSLHLSYTTPWHTVKFINNYSTYIKQPPPPQTDAVRRT